MKIKSIKVGFQCGTDKAEQIYNIEISAMTLFLSIPKKYKKI